jgi:hypothetical protein
LAEAALETDSNSVIREQTVDPSYKPWPEISV